MFLIFFAGCSYYNEATNKKDQDAQKNQILAIVEIQNQIQSLEDYKKKLAMLELFSGGGSLPAECTPPDNDPTWTIPDKCKPYLPDKCSGITTAAELKECGGYNTGGATAGMPSSCSYTDANTAIPSECKSYIASECQSSTTWLQVEQCTSQLTGSLPDTSNNANPTNDYPGSTPSSTGTETGTCFFDTDAGVTGSRDWCCYSTTPSECTSVWKFYDKSGTTFTPVFNVDSSSSADSCYNQGFVYCNSSVKCCYN